MFMIATIQRTDSGIPTQSGSVWMPMTGNVKRCTQIPKPTGIAAAATWPPSFSHQRSPRKSSTAPTVVATAAPSNSPRVSPERSRNASDGTKIPKKSARPPRRGHGAAVEASPLRPVDCAEQPGHAADRRGQQHDDRRSEQRTPDDLQVIGKRVQHLYFVP